MPLAPSFDDLQKRQSAGKRKPSSGDTENMESKSINNQTNHADLSNGCSSIRIIGAGGAGKTAAIRYFKTSDKTIPTTTIDTSGVPIEIDGIEIIKIDNLNGSGKLRKNNIEAISNFIADYTAKTEFEEISVIITSFSGGSGSVCCPLLVDEILRQGKAVIIIGIVDTDSEIDTTNALNCLKTFDNISINRKGYIPMFLFDNNFGRAVVDRGIEITLHKLMTLLTTPYIGLDAQDRMKLINPSVFDSVDTGLKLLNISYREDGEWEEGLGLVIPADDHKKLDATIIISHTDTNLKLTKLCAVTFRGYYEHKGENLIASIGYQVPTTFVKDLNANIHAFRSTNTQKKTDFSSEYDIGEDAGKNGLVL